MNRTLLLAGMIVFIVSVVEAKAEPSMEKQIANLSSEDGSKRTAATKAIFADGKRAMELLTKAGAKQVSPFGTISSRRLDLVFSILEGLKPNPVGGRGGYKTDSFGLHLEQGITEKEIVTMGAKYGFKLSGEFRAVGRPQCYVTLAKGKTLEDVFKAILLNEPHVISLNLNYFET